MYGTVLSAGGEETFEALLKVYSIFSQEESKEEKGKCIYAVYLLYILNQVVNLTVFFLCSYSVTRISMKKKYAS